MCTQFVTFCLSVLCGQVATSVPTQLHFKSRYGSVFLFWLQLTETCIMNSMQWFNQYPPVNMVTASSLGYPSQNTRYFFFALNNDSTCSYHFDILLSCVQPLAFPPYTHPEAAHQLPWFSSNTGQRIKDLIESTWWTRTLGCCHFVQFLLPWWCTYFL